MASLVLWLSLVAPAAAWTPLVREVSTAAPPRSVATTPRDGGRIVVGQDDRIAILDVEGNEIAAADVDGEAVVAWDADGDALVDVIACGSDGLVWLPWAADGSLGAPVVVDASPCSALTVWEAAAGPLLVSSDGSTVSTWSVSAGVFTGPTATGVVLGGPPLIASGDDGIVAGSVGDDVVYVGDTWVSTDVGAAVVALAWRPGDGAWVARADGLYGLADGDRWWTARGAPGPFGFGDLDGDGIPDLAVAVDGDTLVLDASTLAAEVDTAGEPNGPIEVPLDAVDALVVGVIDRDTCADVVVVDAVGRRIHVVTARDCADTRDLDGDGWTAYDGDCADLDGTRHPDHPELCDGVDQDCDGAVDEAGLFVVGSRELTEGETDAYTAVPDGCASQAPIRVAWAADAEMTVCADTGDGGTSCRFGDDGVVRLTATGFDDVGQVVGLGELALTVRNLSPGIDVPRVRVDRCDSETYRIDYGDVAADTVTFHELGGYDDAGFVWLSENGRIEVSPDASVENGSYGVDFVARDEDGGATYGTIDVQVGPAFSLGCNATDTCEAEEAPSGGSRGSSGSDWGCCGGSSSFVLAPLLWVLRRRS